MFRKAIIAAAPIANAGPLASALIEAAAQYPEVDSLELDAVEKAEIAAKDRMLAACGSREIFRPTQGKEDMKARTLLLTIALVALSSQAYARGMLCGEFARHNLVSSDPGSKYNLACNWRDWGRATSAQVGAMVIWCSGHHHHVGKIVGPCNGNMCLVRSGNDDGAIRTRVRSVAGAVFRI